MTVGSDWCCRCVGICHGVGQQNLQVVFNNTWEDKGAGCPCDRLSEPFILTYVGQTPEGDKWSFFLENWCVGPFSTSSLEIVVLIKSASTLEFPNRCIIQITLCFKVGNLCCYADIWKLLYEGQFQTSWSVPLDSWSAWWNPLCPAGWPYPMCGLVTTEDATVEMIA